MHLDAIAHADEIGDIQDKLDERKRIAEKHASEEIRETFTKTVRLVPHTRLSVPIVSRRDSYTARIKVLSLAEAVHDTCTSGKPLDALMAVMEKSDCPLVAAWREAMAADYIYRNASDIGELTA
jgi:hypothetical protein